MKIRWTAAAADDLQQIAEYLNESNPHLAESTVERLYAAAQSLTVHPYRGRVGRLRDTRELLTVPLPYVIVYKTGSDAIRIIRILHGARDWPGSLKSQPPR